MTIKLCFRIALLVMPALSGCYPSGADYIEELDLVYTNYDGQADFASRHTYAIPDSVIKIDGDQYLDPDGDGKPNFVTGGYATTMLARINANMDAYGWQRVDKNANPDVILLVASITTTNIYWYYDWGYWGWWYPGGGYGGWYYPYYPPYATSYRTGSIFIQMVDHKAATPAGENVPVLWSGIVNGLAEGSSTSINSRIQTTINQAFAQSTYLKH